MAKEKAANKGKAKRGAGPVKGASNKKAKVRPANKGVKENPRANKKAKPEKEADRTKAKIPIRKNRKVPVAIRLHRAETIKALINKKASNKVTRNPPREKVAAKTKGVSNKVIPTAKGGINPKAKVANKGKFLPKVIVMVKPLSA